MDNTCDVEHDILRLAARIGDDLRSSDLIAGFDNMKVSAYEDRVVDRIDGQVGGGLRHLLRDVVSEPSHQAVGDDGAWEIDSYINSLCRVVRLRIVGVCAGADTMYIALTRECIGYAEEILREKGKLA